MHKTTVRNLAQGRHSVFIDVINMLRLHALFDYKLIYG